MSEQPIIIAGGTGFIGTALVEKLLAGGRKLVILSRNPDQVQHLFQQRVQAVAWDARTATGWQSYVEDAQAIINLAGANLASGYWTSRRKRLILESRLQAGQAIVAAVTQSRNKPQLVLQASGIGYYGNSGDRQLTEDSPQGAGFLAGVAQQWEQSTAAITAQGVRQVVLRIGPVLGRNGGFLSRAKLPFTFFMGGYFGNGQQWLSWIHLADVVAAIQFLLTNATARGIYNLVAPNPVTNRVFARILGKVMRRPAWLPIPAPVLRLALGAMADELLLSGQRALPHRLQTAGYQFQYPQLELALEDLIQGQPGETK